MISPADDGEAGGDQGLAGDPARRVLRQDGVEDRVGDLVGHLVGMALGHRFRGEGPAGHVCSLGRVASWSWVAGRSGGCRSGWRGSTTTASSTARATARLSRQRRRPARVAAARDRITHLVGVVLEPDAGRGHVVGHDEVDALARELGRRRWPRRRRSRPRSRPASGPARLRGPRSTRMSWVGSRTISGRAAAPS